MHGGGAGSSTGVTGVAPGLSPEQQYGALGDDRSDIYPLKASVQERLRTILRPFFHKCVDWLVGWICVYRRRPIARMTD